MSAQKSYFEVVLMGGPIYETDSLSDVVSSALKEGYSLTELEMHQVVDQEIFKSTKESVHDKALLYLKKEGIQDALIIKGPDDDKYQMFEYRWMA